jgi:Ca-activated chloride channel homolog
MTFRWPLGLLVMLVVPLLIAIFLWQRRKTRKGAVRYSSVALIRSAIAPRSNWRRHIPMALFLLGLLGIGAASARPQARVTVPIGRTSIILALDVSRSMCATDVDPNRLSVAQNAARDFITKQPAGARIGLVVFSGFAELAIAPTTDKESLTKAISELSTSRGTAIGAATLRSIDAIADLNPDVAPIGDDVSPDADSTFNNGETASSDSPIDSVPTDSVPNDDNATKDYVPDIVVVLTDGANTRGIDPIEAAKQAVARRVRVYTIGFGTTNPTAMACNAQQLGGDAFGSGDPFGGAGGGGGFGGLDPGGGGFGGRDGGRRFLVIDEPTLQEMAKMTGGRYYRAQDAGQLKKVFAELPKQVVLQRRNVEISAVFAALAALFITIAAALSLRWNRSP